MKKDKEIIDISPEREKQLVALDRDIKAGLQPFDLEQPYNRQIFAEMGNSLLDVHLKSKFMLGRVLIITYNNESDKTFAEVLDSFYNGLPKSTAKECMLFARKVADLPKMREFAERKGNFTKFLVLASNSTQEELNQAEKTGFLKGLPMDEIDTMTLEETKKKCRRLEAELAAKDAKIKKGEKQINQLEDKLRPKFYTDADEEAMASFHEAHQYMEMGLTRATMGVLKLGGCAPLTRMEAATFYRYMIKRVRDEYGNLLDEYPECAEEGGVDDDAAMLGKWAELIPGTGTKIEDAVTGKGKRTGRA